MNSPVLPDIAALAMKHVLRPFHGDGYHLCKECLREWPCDTAQILDALEDEHQRAVGLAVALEDACGIARDANAGVGWCEDCGHSKCAAKRVAIEHYVALASSPAEEPR